MFLLAVTVILSLVAMPGTVTAAEDEWPDSCADAPYIDTGQYSGAIDTPDDKDTFRLQMDKGEYYSFAMVVPSEQDGSHVRAFTRDISWTNIENADTGGTVGDPAIEGFTPGLEATWRGYAEEDGVYCFEIDGHSDADIPYEWKMSLEKNDPEPAGFEITELQEENDELNSEINDLGSEINNLESQLDKKDERISELESQLENADVEIDVSIEPEDQATFQVGGEMAVSVNSDDAAASDVTLRFGGDQYTPSGGEATIPLESAGTHKLAIEYEDTTETLTLDVASSDAGTNDGDRTNNTTEGNDPGSTDDSSNSDNTDGDSSDGSGPGFGIVGVLAAFGGTGYLLKRRHNDDASE